MAVPTPNNNAASPRASVPLPDDSSDAAFREDVRDFNADAPPPNVSGENNAPPLPTGPADTGPTYGAAGATPENPPQGAHHRFLDQALSALSGPEAKPGDRWRGIIAGALAGAAAGSKAHDFFGGVATGAGAAEQRNLQLRQLGMENELRQKAEERAESEEQREEARSQQEALLNKAQIAHLNMDTYNTYRTAENLNAESQARIHGMAQTFAQPYLDSGSDIIGQNLTASQLQEKLTQGHINPGREIHFQDGFADVLNPNGSVATDKDGRPLRQPTYLSVTMPPQVILSEADAKLLSETTGGKFAAGQQMSGLGHAILVNQALKREAGFLSIAEARQKMATEEAEEEEARAGTAEKKTQTAIQAQLAGLPVPSLDSVRSDPQARAAVDAFAPYLSASENDPQAALHLMVNDPKSNKGEISQIVRNYGGAIKLEGSDYLKTLTPQMANVVKQIGDYKLDPRSALSRYPAQVRMQIQSAVAQYTGGQYDETLYPQKQKLRQEFTSGKIGTAINAYNTAISHLGTIYDHVSGASYLDLHNPYSDVNRQLKIDLPFVSSELLKAVNNGQLTEGERDQIMKSLSGNALTGTVGAYQTKIREAVRFLAGKLGSFQQQWKTGMPTEGSPFPILSPDSQATIAHINGAGPTPQPQAFVRMRAPDGTVRRVPPNQLNAAKSAGLVAIQ